MAKRALLVGINDYKDPNINDLKGCENDLKSMRKVLMNCFGFEPEDIRVLLNDRATKCNIMERIDWLIRTAKSGDYIFLHFSGHGSQIRDRNGDELEDHLDEIICPYDMDWGGTYIVDDELDQAFRNLPEKVLLEAVFDSCHSGTITKALLPPDELRDNNDTPRNRFLEPPFDIICRSDVERGLSVRGFALKSAMQALNHVLWSACKDNQSATDAYIDGRFHGAFTNYFCGHMEATGGRISRLGLFRRISASLLHGGYSQTPQLSVPEDFGIRQSYVSD
jgi:metacaspase-1